MSAWRRYLDLWIVGALLCGLFAYQHGNEVLAAVRPRLIEAKTLAAAKFAEFTAGPPAVPAEEAPVQGAAPVAAGVAAEPPANAAIPIAPGTNPAPQTPAVRQASGTFLVPFCPDAYGHRCPR